TNNGFRPRQTLCRADPRPISAVSDAERPFTLRSKGFCFRRTRIGAAILEAITLRPEVSDQHTLTDRADNASRRLVLRLHDPRGLRSAAQIAAVLPGTGPAPHGLRSYEANVGERNSTGRVARGHGRWPETIRS